MFYLFLVISYFPFTDFTVAKASTDVKFFPLSFLTFPASMYSSFVNGILLFICFIIANASTDVIFPSPVVSPYSITVYSFTIFPCLYNFTLLPVPIILLSCNSLSFLSYIFTSYVLLKLFCFLKSSTFVESDIPYKILVFPNSFSCIFAVEFKKSLRLIVYFFY